MLMSFHREADLKPHIIDSGYFNFTLHNNTTSIVILKRFTISILETVKSKANCMRGNLINLKPIFLLNDHSVANK